VILTFTAFRDELDLGALLLSIELERDTLESFIGKEFSLGEVESWTEERRNADFNGF
jgi:hypothetical protein